MFTKGIAATALLVAKATATIYYAGVAESGGEFGVLSTLPPSPIKAQNWFLSGSTATPGTGLPGTFGVDYEFINKSAIDIYVDQNHVQPPPPQISTKH